METQYINRKHISKAERARRAAQKQEREITIQNALKKHNSEKKMLFPKLVESIYEGNSANGNANTIAYKLNNYFSLLSPKKHPRRRRVFKDILLHLYEQRCAKLLRDNTYINVLFKVAWFSNSFENEISSWKRRSHNTDKQMLSIIKHCFVKYEVPYFMYKAWLVNHRAHISWFIDLTQGRSVRNLTNMPIKMTKKGAHHFLNAPKHYSVEMALRRAQSLSYNADDVIADRIASSHLSRNNFQHEGFWDSVICFFSKQAMLDFSKMNEIIDYLSYRISENLDYSIKGRTIISLTRQSDEWHREQANIRTTFISVLTWDPYLPYSYFRIEESKGIKKTFTLFELCSSGELINEGRKMNHCVASYARSCHSGRSRIFTLRSKEVPGSEEIMATIEVHLASKTIVQAKAKYNKPISKKAIFIIKKWALQHDLNISKWL
ncbi:PcfJ domain-containing protein [Winogradskyella sp. 3972H.M.0a.05]|uniref:PcfJ domain-containing protein n=1 Tax=Winogradskyella sp. 3972H.M.0a.05 TaxID=2950277 RepID=UPI00339A7258